MHKKNWEVHGRKIGKCMKKIRKCKKKIGKCMGFSYPQILVEKVVDKICCLICSKRGKKIVLFVYFFVETSEKIKSSFVR